MHIRDYKKYILDLIHLSLPILAGNLGQMLINVGDVYVAGHYSTNVLAAISVASAIFMTFIVAGSGLCAGITPVLSNYRGERKPVKKLFGITVVYSLCLSVIFFILLWAAIPLVYKIGLSDKIINDTVEYLKISTYSIFGIFLFASLKEFLQAHEIVILPNVLISIGVVLNVVLNFALVWGFWIIPELGVTGLAIASLSVRMLLAGILFLYCMKLLKGSIYKNTKKYIKDLMITGAPIAGAMFIEFLGFNIVAILVGKFEPVYAACHNIIISVTSGVYMVPFSISNALSVKVGYANGARHSVDIKRYTLSALWFVIIYTLCAVIMYLLFKEAIMKLFTGDIAVIKLGASIMIIVACFTVFDGIQSVCMGALKGMKQTLQILMVMFLSYALVSIPTGLILAYKYNKILNGFWFGLALGITLASFTSGIILIKKYFKIKKEYSTPL